MNERIKLPMMDRRNVMKMKFGDEREARGGLTLVGIEMREKSEKLLLLFFPSSSSYSNIIYKGKLNMAHGEAVNRGRERQQDY